MKFWTYVSLIVVLSGFVGYVLAVCPKNHSSPDERLCNVLSNQEKTNEMLFEQVSVGYNAIARVTKLGAAERAGNYEHSVAVLCSVVGLLHKNLYVNGMLFSDATIRNAVRISDLNCDTTDIIEWNGRKTRALDEERALLDLCRQHFELRPALGPSPLLLFLE